MSLCWAPECFVYARNSVNAPGAFQGGCSTGGVPCYSEAVMLVYATLIALAGNCSCYCIIGTTLVRLQECSKEI